MNKKVGFIGAGNMATAIINGLIKNKVCCPSDIYVFDLDTAKLNFMKEKGANAEKSAKELANIADIIVLAVKPQNYSEVLEEIKSEVTTNKVIVSIAAGISRQYVTDSLGCNCPCVRVMPNTPLLLGMGATALSPSSNINEDDFKIVYNMFAMSGVCEILDESKMNTVIAVNGSSPAYIYLFAKAMADYAKEQGIDEKAAMNLICATLKGSAEMLLNSGDSPDTLIKKVSSPGGTTLKALEALENTGFYNGIKQAMESCTQRAEELGK